MRTVRGKVLSLCALTGVLLIAPPRADAAEGPRERAGGAAAVRAQPEGVNTLIYRATGARDAATAATVVTCTNLGAEALVNVYFYEWTGTLDCQVSQTIPNFTSRTMATRGTVLYIEDSVCAVAPDTEQGDIEIYADPGSRIICSVQIIDPAAATPVYATSLDLFRP